MTTKPEVKMTPAELQAKYDGLAPMPAWGEHPELSMREWQHEVANGDTRQGYWEWVQHQLELAAE